MNLKSSNLDSKLQWVRAGCGQCQKGEPRFMPVRQTNSAIVQLHQSAYGVNTPWRNTPVLTRMQLSMPFLTIEEAIEFR
jgi:hypothetical protein